MWSSNDKRWLYFAGPFTGFVVGSLVCLHTSEPETEVFLPGPDVACVEDTSECVLSEFYTTNYQSLVVDTTVPEWVHDAIPTVRARMPEGYELPGSYMRLSKYDVGLGGMMMCEHPGHTEPLPCVKDSIVITLWDRDMAECSGDKCEIGHAYLGEDWCTIMLPPSVEDALPISVLTDPEVNIPPDLAEMVLGHEWIHCRGVGHVRTTLIGPIYSIPTGALMHPNALKSGWGHHGIPIR